MKYFGFKAINYLRRFSPIIILLIISCRAEKSKIKMELYLPAPGEDAAQWIQVSYLDDGLTRKEVHTTSSASDAYLNWQERTSDNNGKTWSNFKVLEQVTLQLPEGGMVTLPGRYTYDPILDIMYQVSMRRLWPGSDMYTFDWQTGAHTYNDHAFILENGHAKEFKYEPGPNFDPNNPFDSTYGVTNRSYLGQDVRIDKNGTAYFPMICYKSGEENVADKGGLVLMRRESSTGEWLASNRLFISPNISSRGLQEPDVTILKNGNLLIVCRGSNVKGKAHTVYPDSLEGRKWYSVSTDGGRTLSPINEFRYDDGSRFYSPSSIHRFIRSSKNGRLYWIANIVPHVPDGNRPRYPLYIAEIEEEIPAVRKNSLVVIEDRSKYEYEKIQFSNFSTLENRETLDIEVYITKIGSHADHPRQGPVYKYLFTPPDH